MTSTARLKRCWLARVPALVGLAALTLATSGCTGTRGYLIEAPAEALRSIYVVRRGWHTGVALPTNEWPNRSWAVLGDFPGVAYLEFGWGDERFYQADSSTFWMGSRAALWPTPSVIHVIGLDEPVPETAQARDIVELRIPADRLQALATAIEKEFAAPEPVPTGSTLRLDPKPNGFYAGRERFYFPRMCNWWTASRLRDAGCDVAPGTVLFASRVIDEARRCAARIHPAGHSP
jgi:hypothetical protein